MTKEEKSSFELVLDAVKKVGSKRGLDRVEDICDDLVHDVKDVIVHALKAGKFTEAVKAVDWFWPFISERAEVLIDKIDGEVDLKARKAARAKEAAEG